VNVRRAAVLLVGLGADELPMAALLEAGLDIEVSALTDFEAAKRQLSAQAPDVLVTALRLGAYNGLHLILRARTRGDIRRRHRHARSPADGAADNCRRLSLIEAAGARPRPPSKVRSLLPEYRDAARGSGFSDPSLRKVCTLTRSGNGPGAFSPVKGSHQWV
jgi:hypothetical protein